jgi:DNA-binding NarL/FixJ family response regulator
MNAWDLLWHDLKKQIHRKRIFTVDVEAYEQLRLVAEHRRLSPREAAAELFGQAAHAEESQAWVVEHWEQLSPRQKQIAAHICRGDTNPQIAEALHISRATVKTHVVSILQKFDINQRAALREFLSPWDLSNYL